MTNYTLEEKDSFTVVGFGTELTTDYANLNKEKSDFWQAISQDGRLDTLKALSTNDYIFSVNERVNGKMMYYAGVQTEESAPEEAGVIHFPKGEYLIVKGEGKTADELNSKLEGIAFGQILPEAKDFAYVGAPNAMVKLGQRNGFVFGEIWIPVVRK
ncbi:GyrI-like domain-containing protein [Shimazuella kribbensis]|uniref:GyrI-like domain-containing protein n=1 Tax=Shimazuella kribbensis TaxID=139808 RepID=UPI0004292FDD|nr:GyrI-like domain-containing protein [Shimazuella kribbensis]